ncbi:hypothetical protein HWC75_gp118 [Salmonella phage 1-19]|uniref:Uncharacterized protein n=15 Tax=Epseptimavirus TaxID=2732017 RepID=A0A5J6T9C6_9CAUD|nr:hypothetical protein CPT_Stitch38 [Salmonella phage Stitch]YP_009804323.1 hypothetical protein HOT54_gp056 [Salmonella phage LVR16A]YP_009804912.1 hypothetical protein HOT59_gp125 [Salmonella phage S113]YP_009805693.1 hypothetical protein HOT64_gp110 [Salmonella phage S132]YP_009818909.1 hypothetical protein HOV02_gp022 [Salmonella phage 3-29]YP_009824429.1 hypothetical protein HOV60_gp028 [Escherichia phage vB_Eco_mar003J3]YP_009851838.1 hypothetical protein HWC64_gp123 [Salmonella phage 
MFAELFTMILLGIWKISLVIFILMIILTVVALVTQNDTLKKVVHGLEYIIMGTFGVCKCNCQRNTKYCWLWMELENCITVALAVSFGMILMALTLALIPLMLAGGVTAYFTLFSPILMYSIYPITMYLVRKRFPHQAH